MNEKIYCNNENINILTSIKKVSLYGIELLNIHCDSPVSRLHNAHACIHKFKEIK